MHPRRETVNRDPHKGLVLVAHGSRRASSNNEIRLLAERLRECAGERFAHVTCAFLEIARPTIPEGIEECIVAGVGEVVVLPYFLSAGRHVVEDIPSEVDIKRKEHPDVPIRIAPYLGSAEPIVNVLLHQAS
jgi:sirohydrochlorin ferrochelatase